MNRGTGGADRVEDAGDFLRRGLRDLWENKVNGGMSVVDLVGEGGFLQIEGLSDDFYSVVVSVVLT